MNLEDFAVFLYALTRLYGPLKALSKVNTKYQIAKVSAERMREMLTLQPKLLDAPDAVPFAGLKRQVEIQHLGFAYGSHEALKDISLTAPAGSKVAFVGKSGSGKTTLANLLARLMDPTSGAILVDGVDLRRIRVRDWRRALAVVTQETILFDDTVETNIAYGAPELDRNRIREAAQMAHADEFIEALPKGYEAQIGPSGSRLSGGQRQRLAIARAIYRNPQVLILDEATSALDNQSQALVQDALRLLMEGRTTFIIAHRISTVREADRIFVIDEGRIVESGKHDVLLSRNGVYTQLVAQEELVGGDALGAPTEQETAGGDTKPATPGLDRR